MKIVLRGTPPSMNAFAGRENVWEYRKAKEYWTRLVWSKCLNDRQKKFEHAMVRIDYWFDSSRRHDADNYAGKFLLDGLTKAGVIADDDLAHISTSIHGHVDRENPRTEITVTRMWDEGDDRI